MPKIRGFKPDLWTDEDFVDLTPFARLLWMGMWSYACDNGHLADKPKQIKMRVLPTDDVNATDLLRELADNGRIVRNGGIITIPNFAKHQRPDKRYLQHCDAPGCRSSGDSQPETRGGNTGTPVASQGPLDDGELKGSEGDVKGGDASARRATQLPDTWQPNDGHRSFADENRLTLATEVAQFRDHHKAKGSTMKDWDAAFRTWLRNAVKFRKDTPAPLAVVTDATQLPPVEESWMRRRPR